MAPTGLDPVLADKMQQLQDLAAQEGISIRITQGYRAPAEQARLYAQGRTTPGPIVTYAKPGSSRHQHGAAFDVVPLKGGQPDWNSPDWDRLGALGKSIGLRWGGDFPRLKDRPHFELAAGDTPATVPGRATPDERALITRLIQVHARKAGIDPHLAVAVATQESRLDPRAVGDNGKSLGLFQLQEAAAIDAGIDPARRGELVENIRGGIAYLKQGLDRFGGDPRQALERHYNRGGDPDYYAHVMQYYPGQAAPAPRPRPGLLARVGQALSPASAEAATMPNATERQALEQRLQAIQARKAQLGVPQGAPAASPATPSPAAGAPPSPAYEVDVQVLGPPGTAAAQGLVPAPTAETQVALLGQQEQDRLAAERAVGSPTRPVTGSLLAPFRQGVQQFFAPVPPEAVPQTTDVVSQWMPGFEFLNVLPRTTQEQIVAEAPPAGRTAAATGIELGTSAAGTALGGPVGGVVGSGVGYGVNVALGLEEPSLTGAGLSLGLPAVAAAAPLARRAVAAGTRWSRAGQAIQQADEAARTAQQTYQEELAARPTPFTTPAQEQARALQMQRRRTALARHEQGEAARQAQVAQREQTAFQQAEEQTAAQQQQYQQQVAQYGQAVTGQQQAVQAARGLPARYGPETPARTLYTRFRDLAPDAQVPLTTLQETAAGLQQQVSRGFETVTPTRLQAVLDEVQRLPEVVDGLTVHRLMQDIGPLTRSPNSQIRGAAKQLYAGFQDALEQGAAQLPETAEARQVLLAANRAARREFAVDDVQRIVRRATSRTPEGQIRFNAARALDQLDRLYEENALFRGAWTPEEWQGLTGQFGELTQAPRIPRPPGAPPEPATPRPVAPFEPRPFTEPPGRAPTPSLPSAPPGPSVPTLTPREHGAFRTFLRGFGLTEAVLTGGLGPLSKVALAAEAKDKLSDALATMMISPRWQPYVRSLMQPDGTVNLEALLALAGGRAALSEAPQRETATPQEAQQAVGTLRQRYAP